MSAICQRKMSVGASTRELRSAKVAGRPVWAMEDGMKSHTWKWMIALSLFAALAMPVGMAAQNNSSQNPKPKHKKYKLYDLGTFGGPGSFINDSTNGGPFINARGDVVGVAQNTTPLSGVSNPYECFPGPTVNHALLWHNGHSIDLGAFPPADQNCSGSNSVGINDAGDITFQSETGTIDPLLGVKELRSVFLRHGKAVDLGTLGGNATASLSINNRDDVVGFALNAVPDPYSLYGVFFEGSSNSTQTRGFIWQNGSMRDLGTLGGPDTLAALLSQSGQIAGLSYTNSIPNPTTGVPTVDPFFWERGRMIDIGTLGGVFGGPNRMNNRGQVVGQSDLVGDTTFHAFLWERGVLRDLGTLGGSTSQATSINDAGDVVGGADFPGDATHDAFLWRHGKMIDLGNLGNTSFARDINNSGQIVGEASLADGTTFHPFLWENGGPMVDLNDLIPRDSPLTLRAAHVINDGGIISGNANPPGCIGNGNCQHAFVLIPDGDCDADNEARIAATQNRITAEHVADANHPARAQRGDSPLTPIERVRSMMRQHYHLPGQAAAPRD